MPPCEVMRRRSLGFVARAFSWLLLDSKAGSDVTSFLEVSRPFSRARETSQEDHGPRHEYSKCLKGEAESWPLHSLGGQPRWLSTASGWDDGSQRSCAPRGMQSRGCAGEPWLQRGLGHGGRGGAWAGDGGTRAGSPDKSLAITEGKVRKASSQRALHPRQSSHIPAC